MKNKKEMVNTVYIGYDEKEDTAKKKTNFQVEKQKQIKKETLEFKSKKSEIFYNE